MEEGNEKLSLTLVGGFDLFFKIFKSNFNKI